MIQRPLVGFEGVRGKRYSLQLQSMSDLSALEEFGPRVVVGPAGSMLETVAVRDIPVFIVAALICIVGLIAFVVGAVVRIREWRLG